MLVRTEVLGCVLRPQETVTVCLWLNVVDLPCLCKTLTRRVRSGVNEENVQNPYRASRIPMSHFNLGGGGSSANRRKFIGPQHRLATRPMSSTGIAANLENIGGRIMVELEMTHHKLRMREVKPSVDTTLPWAHAVQQQQHHHNHHMGSDRYASQSRAAQKLHDAAQYSAKHVPYSSGPAAPVAAPTGGSRPASASAARPASASRGGHPSSRATPGHEQLFDVSTLSPDHQVIYRDMIRVLCGLEQAQCKRLLEHMYREAEDKKLLLGYTGVFPDDGAEA